MSLDTRKRNGGVAVFQRTHNTMLHRTVVIKKKMEKQKLKIGLNLQEIYRSIYMCLIVIITSAYIVVMESAY